MKMLVADGQRRVKEALAHGEKVAVWGPSPGFRDLRWLRPVLAGDTISFSTGIESKRTSESRPGWGIVQTQTGGVNQRGEEVYSIRATAFVPLRDVVAEKAR
jgi:acyl dehydratase